jgi:hypothetical protein
MIRCTLCNNPADHSYEIDIENPKPLCSTCFGQWDPDKLNALLGIVLKIFLIIPAFLL